VLIAWEHIQLAHISLRERVSLRNIDPEKAVRIGAMKVNTVASDNDKCCREK
jgi:hypothetical protein